MTLPEGNEKWQWRHQNLARLWLTQGRSSVETMLENIGRICGEKEERVMRQFLNHEMQQIKKGVELIKPQSIIEEQLQFEKANNNENEN